MAGESNCSELGPQMDLTQLSMAVLFWVFAGAAAKDDERLPNRCEGGTKRAEP